MGGLDDLFTILSSEGLVDEENLAPLRGGDVTDVGNFEPRHWNVTDFVTASLLLGMAN